MDYGPAEPIICNAITSPRVIHLGYKTPNQTLHKVFQTKLKRFHYLGQTKLNFSMRNQTLLDRNKIIYKLLNF